MNIIIGILKESYFLLNKMSPYLLFGFLFAGILHIFIDTKTISRQLGKTSLSSVLKASLFGIPLPLCSCSVIPAAMALRKEGGTRGAVLSFLISTPTTGVDSIFATYSLLGGLFTAYRIIASFVTGTLAGILANIFIKEEKAPLEKEEEECKICNAMEKHDHGILDKAKSAVSYAFGDLLSDSGLALAIGIIIGGMITFFMPETFIETYLGSGLKAMLAMLIVGIPMYVCATASIPIAVALMLKGMNPGAAFVFLVAGPATNIVTMTIVAKNLGQKALAIYLGSIIFSSITLGLLLDKIYMYFYQDQPMRLMLHHREETAGIFGISASIVLIALIVYNLLKNKLTPHKEPMMH